ncbi:RidA family protein [Streptomyces uncialis]|uniref:RidA family protein n=1 Tax=Streptomyces uncialis TaxID=1048205 RepID=UPI0033CE948E
MPTLDVFHHRFPAEDDFGYAQAIRSGALIHVSGQLAFDAAGAFAHADDFPAQLRRTHANLDRVLDHYGATRNQLVSQTLYVVDLRHHATAMADGNRSYFGAHHPASTAVGVTELTFPGQLIEISAVVDLGSPA